MIKSSINQFSRKLIPKTRYGDKIISFLNFIQHQGRLPSRKSLFLNDILYRIKTTDEILDPLRVFVTDKEYLKRYVAEKIGDEYNVPTLCVLKDLQSALEFRYPQDCVIKPTHLSGEVFFKTSLVDIDRTRLEFWFKSNYYNWTREANYRYLKPKIIIEPLIFGEVCPKDYKIFCVNGKPKMIWTAKNRNQGIEGGLFTVDWDRMPFYFGMRSMKPVDSIAKPNNLDEMIQISGELSKEFKFIRVDLYSNDETICVGELTSVHGDNRSVFSAPEGESVVSNLLFGDLKSSWV